MKLISTFLAIFSIAASTSAQAQAETQLASTRIVYNCGASGCVVNCASPSGAWYQLDRAYNKVFMDTYSNGNVQYVFEDGARGVRAAMLSPASLPCKISGLSG